MASVVVGGSRSLSSPLVARVCAALVRSGRSLVVGCATGVDASVLSWAVSSGSVASVSCFAAFAASGAGACGVSAVSAVSAFAAAGGSVAWLSGGALSAPLPARLSARARAAVGFASGGAVFFVSSPSSVGSLAAACAAAARGLPVVVFPVGFSGASLPLLAPGGVWSPSGRSGVWASAWCWSPAPSLF